MLHLLCSPMGPFNSLSWLIWCNHLPIPHASFEIAQALLLANSQRCFYLRPSCLCCDESLPHSLSLSLFLSLCLWQPIRTHWKPWSMRTASTLTCEYQLRPQEGATCLLENPRRGRGAGAGGIQGTSLLWCLSSLASSDWGRAAGDHSRNVTSAQSATLREC